VIRYASGYDSAASELICPRKKKEGRALGRYRWRRIVERTIGWEITGAW